MGDPELNLDVSLMAKLVVTSDFPVRCLYLSEACYSNLLVEILPLKLTKRCKMAKKNFNTFYDFDDNLLR